MLGALSFGKERRTPEGEGWSGARWDRIRQVLERRPKETDFVDAPYSKEEVAADIALIHRREAEAMHDIDMTPEIKELANFFEGFVVLGVNESGWMGAKTKAYRTSEYDDKLGKVDMVLEFDSENSLAHLGLAADVTFSSDMSVIANKVNTIRDRMERGVLSEVKYFHSDATNSNQRLTMIPEVVIGLSKSTIEELKALLAAGDRAGLANHWASIRLLEQMIKQLETFKKHAQSKNEQGLVQIFSHRLGILKKILVQKEDLRKKVEAEKKTDVVHGKIMHFMENWNRY